MYNKIRKNFKKKLLEFPGDLIHTKTGEVFQMSDMIEGGGNNLNRDYSLFLRLRRKHMRDIISNISTKDNGYLLEWIGYGLDENNRLSVAFYDDLLDKMDIRTRGLMIKRLEKGNAVAKIKRSRYMLNPSIAYFGSIGNKESEYNILISPTYS